jgi:3'(2'), 5'-bisphosphate nucleotidase
MTDAELAAHLADYAGRLLVTVRESGVFGPKPLAGRGCCCQ